MFTSTSCVSHRSWRVTFFARLICLSVRKNRNILILCHILGFPRKYSEGFLSAHFQPSSRQVIGFHVVFLARMYSACYRNFFLVIFPDHYRGKNGNRGGHLSVFLLGVKQDIIKENSRWFFRLIAENTRMEASFLSRFCPDDTALGHSR